MNKRDEIALDKLRCVARCNIEAAKYLALAACASTYACAGGLFVSASSWQDAPTGPTQI